ncbi:MAG: hypothetical protein V8Q54_00580, partial [Alistipes senegalensis]
MGHTIEPLRPSLTPLVSSHAQIRHLDRQLFAQWRDVIDKQRTRARGVRRDRLLAIRNCERRATQ